MAKRSKKKVGKTNKARIVIVTPTIEELLLNSNNSKEVSYRADIEGSNLSKACRLDKDVRLSTYARCTSAFEMDTVIFHAAPQIIDKLSSLSLLRTLKKGEVEVCTINLEDLLFFTFHQMETKHGAHSFLPLSFAMQDKAPSLATILTIKAYRDFCNQLLKIHGHE